MRKLTIGNIFKVPSVMLHLGDNKWWVYFIRSVAITLLSWLLSYVVVYNLEDIAVFASAEKSSDFEISDIYNTIANHSDVSYASPDVTVVAVDDCSRQEILDILEIVTAYNPKVIGLDVFFRVASNDSAIVISTLNSIPNLVLPCILQMQEDGQYERITYSFVEKDVTTNYAYVNLNASAVVDVVRDFTPYCVIANGDTLHHIATEMAKIASPNKYLTLQHRNNPTEIVKFSSVTIPVISARDILNETDEDYLSRYLTNRAILIGDVENINDMYSTPINGLVPGIIIHAYALNTIMTEAYTNISPSWLNRIIALLICFLFVFLNMIVKNTWSHMGNMCMRFVQILLMFSMVYIGSYWYTRYLQYIDFSLLILMIGFSALAVDIYDGIYAIGLQITKYIKTKKV